MYRCTPLPNNDRFMKTGLLILAILLYSYSFAQTNLIFHKSHSGSKSTFANTFPNRLSNFGAYPVQRVQQAVLDSVIYISDSTAVMITSNYCPKENRSLNQDQYGKNIRTQYGYVWSEGRDTVLFHPLFSRQHALDSIRKVLREAYYFKNDIDSTTFVGYDNQAATFEKKIQVPPAQPQDKSKHNELYLILLFVTGFITFSLAFGKKPKQFHEVS